MPFLSYVTAFLSAATLTGLIVKTVGFHAHLSADEVHGVQKIHGGAVPRVGGMAIVCGSISGGLMLTGAHSLWMVVSLCALPAFVAGFWEDITKGVSVRVRLLATIVAGGIFSAITGYSLHHLGLPGIDLLLAQPLIAIAFTAFAVGGIANAINIIDGCNGLSSGTSIILFLAFGLIAHTVGDLHLFAVCMLFAATIGGFLVWNFPLGKIFLGDAGAYSIGFALAAVAVALPARNPSLSPVIGLLMLIYPVSETVYSMIRRSRKKTGAVGEPDSMHLHSLTFKALRTAVSSRVLRNSLAGAILWVLPLSSAGLAYALRSEATSVVLTACGGHFVVYCLAYYFAKRAAMSASLQRTAVAPITVAPPNYHPLLHRRTENIKRDLVEAAENSNA